MQNLTRDGMINDLDLLNGLDVFSGTGGITIALNGKVKPIAYCENCRYAQSVLLSRMSEGILPNAPIWDDIRTLRGEMFDIPIHVIYGGFPCQDISVAGLQKGLDGERSGLVFEVFRLCRELKPVFIFLENVPAIRTNGLDRILQELTCLGYDCRWTMLSAAEVGANHKRNRWWLLGYSERYGSFAIEKSRGHGTAISNSQERPDKALQSAGTDTSGMLSYSDSRNLRPEQEQRREQGKAESGNHGTEESMADSACLGCEFSAEGQRSQSSNTIIPGSKELAYNDKQYENNERYRWSAIRGREGEQTIIQGRQWWDVEPDVGRVADGVPCRMDRIKCLGNAVVPFQAKEAIKELMGIR